MVCSADVAFFNTEVLGKATSDDVILIEKYEKKEGKLIQPKIIQVDVANEIYTASSVYYPANEIKFNELVSLIDKKYPNSKKEELSGNTFVAWRVESQKFAISFANEIEEEMYRVIYIKFR